MDDDGWNAFAKMLKKMKAADYIPEQMEITSNNGMPILCPHVLCVPRNAGCYELDDQYMFVSDSLFASIMEREQTSCEDFLPEGGWVLMMDGSAHDGDRS